MHLEITWYTLCKIVLCIWRKKNFSATIILWKKVILSYLKKMNLKISHKLRWPERIKNWLLIIKINYLNWLLKLIMCNRVWIKHIAIAKCDLFFHYRDAKEISFYYFLDAKLCVKCECVFFFFYLKIIYPRLPSC